jgi:dienelactone hydrolase
MIAFAALCLLAPGCQQPVGLPDDPAAALAAAVDLATPALRKNAAEALARRAVTLEQWLTQCAAFGTFAAEEAGPQRHVVDLQVGDAVEHTEVFLYVPKGYDAAQPAPLLLMGHGTGDTGARCYLHFQTVADQLGMLVLAPSEAGPNGGWAFTPRERLAHLAALRWARRKVNVDEDRVFVTGFSRGGHMSWDMVLRYPDRFAAAAPVVGGPRLWPLGNNNMRYLENVAQLPIRDVQGEKDDAIMIESLRRSFERLQKSGNTDAQLILQKEHGHEDTDIAPVDWAAFFGKARRDPLRPKVVCMAANKDQARAFWVEITAFDQNVVEVFPIQVPASVDEPTQRRMVVDQSIEHTARLQVSMTAPGRFRAEGKGCKRFRLLLTPQMIGADGSAEVVFAGKTSKLKPKPDAAVLLREFVERFDRRFLPVAVVDVP